MSSEDIVKCENCDCLINCNKHNIYILYKDANNNFEELTYCQECYEDLKDEMKEDGWNCDDFSDNEEE